LATAPHLHFEVLVGGVHRNPGVAFKNQTGDPLAEGQRSSFAALKARMFSALQGPLHGAHAAPVRAGGD
jgi:murein DD-endopeptidase MepM/ murein hydrolase activator NlpD